MRFPIRGLLGVAGMAASAWACGDGTNAPTAPTGCAATLSPSSQNVSASGGGFAASITVASGCEWTASTTESWVTLIRASGSGSGSAAYTIAGNATGRQRSGRIHVGGDPLAITQAAGDCSYTVDAPPGKVPANGATVDLRVATGDGCEWSASSSDGWISLPVTSGEGPRTVAAVVAANTDGPERVGTVEIAGQDVAISQSASAPAPACGVTLSGRTFDVPQSGGSVEIVVTVGPGCSWRTQGLPDWIRTNLESSSASARPVFTVTRNTSRERSATFRIADQEVTIKQAGLGCSYTVTPASQNVPDAGGSAPFTVTADAGCEWTAGSSDGWLRTSPSRGSGNGTVTVTAAANAAASGRSGSVQIAGKAVRVEQGVAAPCSYTLGATSANVGVGGGAVSFRVETLDRCAWKAMSGDAWIQVTSGSGKGTDTVTATVAAWSGSAERRGTISVEGRAFTVTQAPCSYAFGATSANVGVDGGTITFSVNALDGCAWKASTGDGWIQIASGSGQGTGTVTATVAAWSGSTERRGTISVEGRAFTITQAAPCTYSGTWVSTATRGRGRIGETMTAAAAGDTLVVTVNTGRECSWRHSAAPEWIRGVTAAEYRGPADIKLPVPCNTAKVERHGSMSIAGFRVGISQPFDPEAPCMQ